MGEQIHVSRHPLVLHKLSYLRQPREIVHSREYSRLIYELGMMLAYEASVDLKLVDIDTKRGPLRRPGRRLDSKDEPVIVPIVRSGLVLADGMRAVIPTRHMGHIGVYDDPETKMPTEFMVTMPEDMTNRIIYIADLFVVRGETACRAIEIVNEYGVDFNKIIFVTLVISHFGYQRIINEAAIRGAKFYCARLDKDGDKWLSDYGDVNSRLYGTPNKENLAI